MGYLAVVVLAVATTWAYQTEWAGKMDGLEMMYLIALALPWSLIPSIVGPLTDHGSTIYLGTLCLLNWVFVVALIERFLRLGHVRLPR